MDYPDRKSLKFKDTRTTQVCKNSESEQASFIVTWGLAIKRK